jgi:hypothetical protein
MAKVKCNVARMKDLDLVAFARNMVTSMTGNPVYADLQGFLPTLSAATEEMADAIREATFNGGRIEHVHKRTCVQKVGDLINALVPRVQAASGGDELKIMSAGFDVRKGRGPSQVPETPHALRTLLTRHDGMMQLRWSGHRHAHYFQVSMQQPDGEWEVVATTTRCAADLTGLVTGKRYAMRITAFGTGGRMAVSGIVALRAA